MLIPLYDKKPPKHKWLRFIVLMMLFTLICFGIAAIFTSCYNQKKATKQLNKAHDIYPSLVADKLHKWYPEKNDSVKKGKPVYIFKTVTDTSKYKSLRKTIDSLFANNKLLLQSASAKQIDVDSLRDEITNEVLRNCGTFNDTCQSNLPDTIYRTSSETQTYIQSLADSLNKYKELYPKQVQQIADLKSDRNRWIFSSVGELIIILLLAYLLIRYLLKKKATNQV